MNDVLITWRVSTTVPGALRAVSSSGLAELRSTSTRRPPRFQGVLDQPRHEANLQGLAAQ